MTLEDKVLALRRLVMQRAAHGRQSQPALEHAVLAYALRSPAAGPQRTANHLVQRHCVEWHNSCTGTAPNPLGAPGAARRADLAPVPTPAR